MTSTNEEMPTPPKPRISPFDYRNTDLVSRLLAATPPYLYNLPLVPHNFFFSEMLRSLVQAKTENANRNAPATNPPHHRRSRKRSWMQAHPEFYHHKQEPPKIEKPDMPPPSTNWISGKSRPERPLELTSSKIEIPTSESLQRDPRLMASNMHHQNIIENQLNNQENKPNLNVSQFPFIPQQSAAQTSDLILPPPPPVWYPPLYPSPYAIDPLHFFIDLRVSGHIYDRKNSSKDSPTSSHATTPSSTATSTSPNTNNSNVVISNDLEQQPTPPSIENKSPGFENISETFRSSRHASAFSVPSPRTSSNLPINLSTYHATQLYSDKNGEHNNNNACKSSMKDSSGRTKFDVKSLGLEKVSNKTSSNYVMANIARIYKELSFTERENEGQTSMKVELVEMKQEDVLRKETSEEIDGNTCQSDKEMTEEEKRVKDLRALIGLELVVDYMNHSKPDQRARTSEESSTDDFESLDSPAVDVEAVHDDEDGCEM